MYVANPVTQAKSILDILLEVEKAYPQPLQNYLRDNRSRFLYEIEKILKHVGGNRDKVLDIGAGLSPLPIVLAIHGLEVTIIDDFRDPVHREIGSDVLSIHKQYGVEVIQEDVFHLDLAFKENELNAVVILDSMEHWHQSPKSLFHRIYRALKPRGLFLLSVPNCVNARKRITIPLGYGKWSSMTDWYENDVFRGHVREPDVDDLQYIARDLKFTHYTIVGKNWMGYRSLNCMIRAITPLVDRLLQVRPTLCSDIYLIARK